MLIRSSILNSIERIARSRILNRAGKSEGSGRKSGGMDDGK